MKILDEILQRADEGKKTDRKGHLVWKKGDFEVNGKKGRVKEEKRHERFAWDKGQIEILKKGKPAVVKEDVSHQASSKGHDLGYDLSRDAHKAFRQHHDSLSNNHHNWIANYKSNSDWINQHHRNGTKPGDHDNYAQERFHTQTKHLDEATSHHTTEDHHVYRAFSHHAGIHDMHPGTEFQDHGYTGTSFDHDTAKEFAKEYQNGYVRRYTKIHVPKGTKAHFLDNDNAGHDHTEEQELLLHRGTKFRVVKHESVHHGNVEHHVTHLEVIGQHPREVK